MTLPELRSLLADRPDLTCLDCYLEANVKICACCGKSTREEQLIDSELGLCCLACDQRAVLEALSGFGIDCDELVRDFDRAVAL